MSPKAREKEPVIRQIFIGRGPDIMVTDALERKLFVIRKAAGHAIQALDLKHCKEFGGTLKDKEIIQMLKGELGNCTEPTYYRYKKELIEQSGQMKLNS